jgi:hypothetical protein
MALQAFSATFRGIGKSSILDLRKNRHKKIKLSFHFRKKILVGLMIYLTISYAAALPLAAN